MAPHVIDIVAGGPPPLDPYEPAAPAWALAEGLASGGRSVRVLYPSPSVAPRVAPPPGVTVVPVELRLRHTGSASDPADFAREAGARVRPEADSILRDPVGLGPLGSHRKAGHPRLIGFVRSLGISEFDRGRAGAGSRGVAQRLDSWRERRTIRRLERAAISEADRLLYDDTEVGAGLAREVLDPGRAEPRGPPRRRPRSRAPHAGQGSRGAGDPH